MASELFAFTIEEKLAELKRELKLRHQVYPRRIYTRRLSKKRADRQLALLESIIDDYTHGPLATTPRQ